MSSDSAGQSIGSMASSITGSLANITKIITAGSYIAGLGFSVGAIFKFKNHKDNPTQIPVGTSGALAAVAAIQTYLPSIEAGDASAQISAAEDALKKKLSK